MSFIRSNTLKLSAMAAATGIALMSTAVYAADPVSADPFNAHINIVSSSTCGIEVTPAPQNSFTAVLDVNVASGTTHYTTIPPKDQDGMLTIVKAIGGTSCDLNSGLNITARPMNSVAATNGSASNMAVGGGIVPAAFQMTYLKPYGSNGTNIAASQWQRIVRTGVNAPTATNKAFLDTTTELNALKGFGQGTWTPRAAEGDCKSGNGGLACFGWLTSNMTTDNEALNVGFDRRNVTDAGVWSTDLTVVSPGTATKVESMSIGFGGIMAAYPTDLNGTKDLSLVHDGSSGSLQYTVDITLV
ncbi:hypothetical protein ACOY5X_22770 [Enterobacter kobei]|uniref:hypothetical protein n=1 Tax=Enterobacter kobei TaxID=208224 RepID=UPI003BEEF316